MLGHNGGLIVLHVNHYENGPAMVLIPSSLLIFRHDFSFFYLVILQLLFLCSPMPGYSLCFWPVLAPFSTLADASGLLAQVQITYVRSLSPRLSHLNWVWSDSTEIHVQVQAQRPEKENLIQLRYLEVQSLGGNKGKMRLWWWCPGVGTRPRFCHTLWCPVPLVTKREGEAQHSTRGVISTHRMY